MVFANSVCLSERLPSGFSVRSFERMRSEFRRRAQLVAHIGQELDL
jgi:hypothetical protein